MPYTMKRIFFNPFFLFIFYCCIGCSEPSKDVCACLEQAIDDEKIDAIDLMSCQRKNEKYLETLDDTKYEQYIRDLSSCPYTSKLNTVDRRYKLLWGRWKNSENVTWNYKPDGTLVGLDATGNWRMANGIITINTLDYEIIELTAEKYKIKTLNQKISKVWEATKIKE